MVDTACHSYVSFKLKSADGQAERWRDKMKGNLTDKSADIFSWDLEKTQRQTVYVI